MPMSVCEMMLPLISPPLLGGAEVGDVDADDLGGEAVDIGADDGVADDVEVGVAEDAGWRSRIAAAGPV